MVIVDDPRLVAAANKVIDQNRLIREAADEERTNEEIKKYKANNPQKIAQNMNWYKKSQQLDKSLDDETKEDREDRAMYEYMEKADEERLNILREFQEARKRRRAKWNSQPWSVIPAARLIKIWKDYARNGVVRDERGMEEIVAKVISNIARLQVNTELVGHTQINPEIDYAEDLEYYGIKTEKDRERLQMFIQDDKFSDRALRPLQQIAMDLLAAITAEEKLLLVDRALNIVHCRGDIAACFVEGGENTLNYLKNQGVQLTAKNKKWYKKAQSKKAFVGDCATGLDNDTFQRYIAQDATELAQLIENSNPISLDQFLDLCMTDEKFRNRILRNKDIFEAGQFNDVIWLWDTNRDIHYFYVN
jgi:hypothetical protein